MAQKRMFDKSIVETDEFMDMPMPTKALYFLLGMEADDEGFVSPSRVMRIYGGNPDDLKVLVAKKFVIQFESGVVVITDWHENNYLDRNRMKKTRFQAEKALLMLNSNKYAMLNACLTDAKQMLSQYSIEENSIEEKRREENKGRFAPPSLSEITEYINQMAYGLDPQDFLDKNEASGWIMNGGKKVKDWKAHIRSWETRRKKWEKEQPAESLDHQLDKTFDLITQYGHKSSWKWEGIDLSCVREEIGLCLNENDMRWFTARARKAVENYKTLEKYLKNL